MSKTATALTCILAILALAGCGETPTGTDDGTKDNPMSGYIAWYETPDRKAKVQCFNISAGVSCDWDHVIVDGDTK
ncbi:hypothetical protein JS528_11215 [Bifidobacterium sp. MA2]|uniref:Lipoprotein n=1 Tax=Bifidobacterium santillanense TaxID=2809028 RepID=A0ABS5USZ8_9BIFI|nr:hypothetical protein [Bifidobacterium santillanense]MBT1173888.1 hypothetical protein [Bifidobacterium santillanense]